MNVEISEDVQKALLRERKWFFKALILIILNTSYTLHSHPPLLIERR